MPLFDKYNVDLVVCGHEHHYERSHPIRGQEANRTLTPKPAATRHRRDRYDQGHGTHGDRRRWNVGSVERAIFQSAAVPGDCLGRVVARSGHGQAAAGLRQGGCALVGGTERSTRLRLRGFHCRSGIGARRVYHDEGRLLRCGGSRRSSHGIRNVHVTASSARLARISPAVAGCWRRALSCQRVFAPPPVPGVFAQHLVYGCENLLARQGPSQRPRPREKCALAPAIGHARCGNLLSLRRAGNKSSCTVRCRPDERTSATLYWDAKAAVPLPAVLRHPNSIRFRALGR